MKRDEAIEDIRKVRHRISEQFNHDTKAIIRHYQELEKKLSEIKTQFPKLEDVIISPSSEILYHVIVKVLDNCREVGFPNYSISG